MKAVNGGSAIVCRFSIFVETTTLMKNQKLEKAWLAALLLCPFVLWVLPADIFDNTGIDICPSKLLFDYECFGCGMTRAVMHLHHFEFQEAIFYNYGVVAIYPALVVVWFIWVKNSAQRLGILGLMKVDKG